MRHVVILALCFNFLFSEAQIYIKTGAGIATSSPTGLITEVDGGYLKNNNQLSLGWQFNPQISKTFFSIKYGYWYKDFVFHGGIGLVNQIENRATDYYAHAYGAPIIGFEYNFKEFTESSRTYFGVDVVDKTVNIKFGLKVFYD